MSNTPQRRLRRTIARKLGITYNESLIVYNTFFEEFNRMLLENEYIRLPIGVFKRKIKEKRKMMLFGKYVEIPKRTKIEFKPSKKIKDKLNPGVIREIIHS